MAKSKKNQNPVEDEMAEIYAEIAKGNNEEKVELAYTELIKKVDENISLEALNLINKGLTDVSNAQKGKVVMPTALKLSEMKKSNAAVRSSLCNKNLGEMLLNDKLFSIDDFEKFASEKLKMPDEKK